VRAYIARTVRGWYNVEVYGCLKERQMKSIRSLKLTTTILVLILVAAACGPTSEPPTVVPPSIGEESPEAEMLALAGGKLVYGLTLTLSPSGIDPCLNASSELGVRFIEVPAK
jgi:hypothetical protein